MSLIDELRNQYPWMDLLGVTPQQLQGWVADGLSGDAILVQVRETPEYRQRFPGIRRQDGTLRASESQYLATNDAFRQVMRQFGDAASRFDDPSDFAALWDNEIDPNELRDRFEIYDTVRSAHDVKDAFYVYAGLRPSDDELYTAVVNPDGARQLSARYNSAVAAAPLDYQTFIQRATERSLERVVSTLEDLNRRGVGTTQALASVRNVDPQFASQMTDLLLHGGDVQNSGNHLALSQLTRAFEYAMIGSAAASQGFRLPTGARLEQLRLAGIDRARALQGYGQFAQDGNRLRAMVNRLRGADVGFEVEDFERAVFLNSAPEQELLTRAAAKEAAFGRQTGGPSAALTGGRLVLQGLDA